MNQLVPLALAALCLTAPASAQINSLQRVIVGSRLLSVALTQQSSRRPSGGQRHGQNSTTAGIKRRSILILMAFLASIGLISEGASQAESSPYTRLILYNSADVRQYELMQFTNATDACNFFGAPTTGCNFANEYFAGWGGSYTATLEFYRFPTESSRAHLYGGGVAALSTPAQLAAALDAGTTLRVPLNGVTLTACFGTGAGCTNLAGLTTYEQIASAVESALNASPVTLGTITGNDCSSVNGH